MIDITQDQIFDDDRIDKSAYFVPQIPIKKQNEDEEKELSPLVKHRLTQIDDKYGRKNRWTTKVEKEDVRTQEISQVASERASSCRATVSTTLNQNDGYSQYNSILSKMNNNCITKIKKYEEIEARKLALRNKRLMLLLPGAIWRNGNAPIDKKSNKKSNNSTIPDIQAKPYSSSAPKKFSKTPA